MVDQWYLPPKNVKKNRNFPKLYPGIWKIAPCLSHIQMLGQTKVVWNKWEGDEINDVKDFVSCHVMPRLAKLGLGVLQ